MSAWLALAVACAALASGCSRATSPNGGAVTLPPMSVVTGDMPNTVDTTIVNVALEPLPPAGSAAR